ncbi:MAG: cyanophycinase [Chitinophagales bacterium]
MKQTFYTAITASLFLIIACNYPSNQQPTNNESNTGTLFIIGGGDRDDTLMQQMIDVSGWKKGDVITAITLPSTYDSSYYWINNQLQQMTGQACVKFDSAAIHDEKKLDSLSQSKIIFIGGGDQLRMMQLIEGSEVKKIIQQAYREGATIGGTSAGAAVMSSLMITGNQLMDTVYASTFPVLLDSNLELKEGLGLLDSVIVDMHFIARSRYNRLFSAIVEHPEYQCIGIDETTAIIIHNDSATVAGVSEVMVIETPDEIRKGPHHLVGARDIDVSVYLPGDQFPIKR